MTLAVRYPADTETLSHLARQTIVRFFFFFFLHGYHGKANRLVWPLCRLISLENENILRCSYACVSIWGVQWLTKPTIIFKLWAGQSVSLSFINDYKAMNSRGIFLMVLNWKKAHLLIVLSTNLTKTTWRLPFVPPGGQIQKRVGRATHLQCFHSRSVHWPVRDYIQTRTHTKCDLKQ